MTWYMWLIAAVAALAFAYAVAGIGETKYTGETKNIRVVVEYSDGKREQMAYTMEELAEITKCLDELEKDIQWQTRVVFYGIATFQKLNAKCISILDDSKYILFSWAEFERFAFLSGKLCEMVEGELVIATGKEFNKTAKFYRTGTNRVFCEKYKVWAYEIGGDGE